jgi:hypothetical protein
MAPLEAKVGAISLGNAMGGVPELFVRIDGSSADKPAAASVSGVL